MLSATDTCAPADTCASATDTRASAADTRASAADTRASAADTRSSAADTCASATDTCILLIRRNQRESPVKKCFLVVCLTNNVTYKQSLINVIKKIRIIKSNKNNETPMGGFSSTDQPLPAGTANF